MPNPKCVDCGRETSWYDHASYNSGRCRECRSNAEGKCARIVFDSSNSRDVLGHACSFKFVGHAPSKGFGEAIWKYCKRHGGIPGA